MYSGWGWAELTEDTYYPSNCCSTSRQLDRILIFSLIPYCTIMLTHSIIICIQYKHYTNKPCQNIREKMNRIEWIEWKEIIYSRSKSWFQNRFFVCHACSLKKKGVRIVHSEVMCVFPLRGALVLSPSVFDLWKEQRKANIEIVAQHSFYLASNIPHHPDI